MASDCKWLVASSCICPFALICAYLAFTCWAGHSLLSPHFWSELLLASDQNFVHCVSIRRYDTETASLFLLSLIGRVTHHFLSIASHPSQPHFPSSPETYHNVNTDDSI